MLTKSVTASKQTAITRSDTIWPSTVTEEDIASQSVATPNKYSGPKLTNCMEEPGNGSSWEGGGGGGAIAFCKSDQTSVDVYLLKHKTIPDLS